MPDLPTGTITFLLTDVEGSTRLWEAAPAAMGAAMARHDALIEAKVAYHSGELVRPRGEGDSRFAVFSRAYDAAAAARDVQQAFGAQAWPTPAPLSVRIALHTGEADLRSGDYYGSDVNRCARLRALANGGQTLLSQSTYELICDSLPERVSLRDLGEHRLKDLLRPEHIYQLCVTGLPPDFPPLQSVDSFPNNLPVQLTSFIGREGELAEVRELLGKTHLLTLTGPGGTGKTRLSLQLAADVLTEFSDGAWLVELAPISDPTLIPQSVASTVGVREQPGRSLLEALTDYVRAKKLLLILDNCEHLVDASAKLANTLLRAAPGLKILASSREALGIGGETAYRVPSLPLPDTKELAGLAHNECVRLFLDRAGAARPGFCLTEGNAMAVADICRRLDGIPLAIELAAARVRVFSPREIAARLDDRFRLLTGGSRAALERHQTLRALVDWSYDLLPDQECRLLRRLSVFAGGWTLGAAQEVAGEGGGEEMLEPLVRLVDKSLVVVEEKDGEGRYRFLETVRQYARDKLFESGEGVRARNRHLEYFLRFAEKAEPRLRSGQQLEWLERLEVEYDNLRAALSWAQESSKSDLALQLAGGLYYFWVLRGHFSEGEKWLNEALALSERVQAEGRSVSVTQSGRARRAKVLYGICWMQMGTMGMAKARATAEESLRSWRELGDRWWTAVALEQLALITTMSDYEEALAYLEEGIRLARQIEDPWPLAVCLVRMGDALKPRGELAAAHPFLEEGVALARAVGDRSVLSEGLRELGSLYYAEGDLDTAESLTNEALEQARAIQSAFGVFLGGVQLVIIACLQNDPAKARHYCRELWTMALHLGALFASAFALLASGVTECFLGEPGRGVRLVTALEELFARFGITPPEGDVLYKVVKQGLERARGQLGPDAFEAAQEEGRGLTPEQAIALALEQKA